MTSEQQLRAFLISAFQYLRAQHSSLASVMAEVASVRDALIEIGPKYAEILERHRAHHVKDAKPLVDDEFRRFEEIIEQLKSSGS